MTVLVLRLAGPLQSWGISSNYDNRSSGTEPSKSAVIGMIAAAMGRSRDDPVDDLASLRFGVRRDQDGRILTDFHMAHTKNDKDSYVTKRQYISDAIFLAALEGEKGLLEKIDDAIQNPLYPIFLGRRSCPPSGKVSMGISEGTLEQVLSNYDWQASDWYRRKKADRIRLEIISDTHCGAIQLGDQPLSFSQTERRFQRRTVRRWFSEREFDNPLGKRQYSGTEHDAIAAVREEI